MNSRVKEYNQDHVKSDARTTSSVSRHIMLLDKYDMFLLVKKKTTKTESLVQLFSCILFHVALLYVVLVLGPIL